MKIKDQLTDNKFTGFFTNFLNQNSPTLAMIGGIGLLGCALVAAFKASQDVTKIKEDFDRDVAKVTSQVQEMPVETKTIKELKTHRNISYVLAYRWVILFGIGSSILMFLCNYLNGAKIAGLTALAAWKQDEIKSFAKNAKEIIGEEKFKEIDNKTLEEMLLKSFQSQDGPFAFQIDPKGGDVFIDATVPPIMFQAHEEELTESLRHAKEDCARNHSLAYGTYLEKYLGLEPNDSCPAIYWGPNSPFDAWISKRDLFGGTFRIIEHRSPPTDGYRAGIPGFNK